MAVEGDDGLAGDPANDGETGVIHQARAGPAGRQVLGHGGVVQFSVHVDDPCGWQVIAAEAGDRGLAHAILEERARLHDHVAGGDQCVATVQDLLPDPAEDRRGRSNVGSPG